MSEPVGTLQVSVIEGRNIKAKKGSLEFMVKVALDSQQARTDVVRGTLVPKWVKDMKMSVESPSSGLKIELFQGMNAVMGSVEIPMQTVMDARTQVQWFKVTDRDGELVGEVCLVLRFVASKAFAERSPPKAAVTSPARTPARTPGSPPVYRTVSPMQQRSRGMAGGAGGQGQKQRGDVPWPLLIVGAVVAGAIGIFTRNRPRYYTVEEGDTLCTIGACYNKSYDEIFDENDSVLTDPNIIFPGEKLKL